ncbi:FAD/NAD(P)-binding protein [Glarea lozoyensis ATCC 20868]|uniref:FAD/NAD(P)-binding protein n=1 Tax=Glarea lozoyensis (strain ATCC 20868 / MF5171) TaxID=1116229 RepID=S3DCH4_GLAL2|nr:FAD/NAD(P)-binding protein [Glarea lozoyensis ATCC 20868]EPE24373.1 FAD/NAD(P)-binding protein [Glarea lozoyensis ATCC 20868]
MPILWVAFSFLVLYIVELASSVHLRGRSIDARFLDCYDYIVVGGGISGLVVANRLTEDPTVSVLILEAGHLDDYEEIILNPNDDGDGLGTNYDWNLWTAPQTFLDGQSRPYDMGRGVGGGSLINGLEGLAPVFQEDNVDAEFGRELYIKSEPDTHGTDGYVHVSYPKFFYNQSRIVLEGLRELGIPILTYPNNGTAAGGMLIPSSISPENQTRSDARLAYFDNIVNSRPNFHVATGKHVYRLILETPQSNSPSGNPGDIVVKGVEFVPDGTLSILNVTCSREVILAAGAVHTPQILELSGIGDAKVLETFDIPVKLNLPGIGNNFQDHPYVGVVYYVSNLAYLTKTMINNNPNLLAQAEQEYYVNKTGPWTAGAINTVAFPSLLSISKNAINMVQDATSQTTTQYLLPDLDPTILAGYAAQKEILVSLLNRTDVGASMRQLAPVPYYPFLQDATPETLIPAIFSGLRTEFHGTGTTSMMPLERGGVVDTHLRVYGTKNLRIVDAGIFPLVPAAHLQAPVYAVAEKAADIIKADNAGIGSRSCPYKSSFSRIFAPDSGSSSTTSSSKDSDLSPPKPNVEPSTQNTPNANAKNPILAVLSLFLGGLLVMPTGKVHLEVPSITHMEATKAARSFETKYTESALTKDVVIQVVKVALAVTEENDSIG